MAIAPSHFLHFSEIGCGALMFPPFVGLPRQAKRGDWVLISTALVALLPGARFFRGSRVFTRMCPSPWGRLGQKHLLVYLKSCAGHYFQCWQIWIYFVKRMFSTPAQEEVWWPINWRSAQMRYCSCPEPACMPIIDEQPQYSKLNASPYRRVTLPPYRQVNLF